MSALIFLNASSPPAALHLSGWMRRTSFRYAARQSAYEAFLPTPKIARGPLRALEIMRCTSSSSTVNALEGAAEVAIGDQVYFLRLARPRQSPRNLENISNMTEALITGGTSGLGMLTARWLAQRGVRRLLLAHKLLL